LPVRGGARLGRAEEDARRALEIAEAIDSPYLLLHAVEALIGYASLSGFCEAAELGERLAHAGETLTSRPDAHEARITAAISLTRAGRYKRARELARDATQEAVRMSPHRATHAASAEAHCLVPAGRFEELIEVTTRVLDVVRDEGGRLCQTGSVGLAGRALALYERGEQAAASEALELFESAPPPEGLVHLHWLAIDMLRPLAGAERTRQTGQLVADVGTTPAGRIYELRLKLQLSALLGEWTSLADLIPEARAVASRACAPSLGWTADWAQAVQRAAAGEGDKAVSDAMRAARALEDHGEPYTAARLLTDLLPFLERDLCTPVAERVASSLHAMGALTSATTAAVYG
jgi:hypothetical protein